MFVYQITYLQLPVHTTQVYYLHLGTPTSTYRLGIHATLADSARTRTLLQIQLPYRYIANNHQHFTFEVEHFVCLFVPVCIDLGSH